MVPRPGELVTKVRSIQMKWRERRRSSQNMVVFDSTGYAHVDVVDRSIREAVTAVGTGASGTMGRERVH